MSPFGIKDFIPLFHHKMLFYNNCFYFIGGMVYNHVIRTFEFLWSYNLNYHEWAIIKTNNYPKIDIILFEVVGKTKIVKISLQ